ncbi:MAG: ABC transporter substrate-binding protein [Pedobacter sp.]|nr:ABC transporter substrate-binding protein [Pedobacter sp.]
MSQSNASQPGNPVELYYTRCGSATASALAIRKNWLQAEFAKPGTILHSLRDSESLETRNSHYHHKQTGMFREGGNIPPIWARGIGQETAVVGITWLDEYQGILVRKDSGIREIADLKGKRLGVPLHKNAVIDFQRGAAQHGYETALSLVGLKTTDVTLVDLEAPSYDNQDGPRATQPAGRRNVVLDALENGLVDAIFLRFAQGFRLSQDPRFHEVININTLKDPLLRVNNGTPRPVTVDRAFLEKNPEVVVRYLAVLLRTAEWAAQNREEVLSLLAPEDGGATVAEVIGSHGHDVHLSFEPKLTPEYIKGLETQKDFLHRWGYFKDNFDINNWIVSWPLEEARKLVEQERAAARSAA